MAPSRQMDVYDDLSLLSMAGWSGRFDWIVGDDTSHVSCGGKCLVLCQTLELSG